MSVSSSLSSGTSPTVTFGGLGSGLNISSIVQALAAAEQAPLRQLQSQQQDIQTRQGIYAQLQSQLTALSSAAQALNSQGAFTAVSPTSSDTSVASLTLGAGTASAGVYTLSVSKLAFAQKVASAPQTDVTSALSQTGTFQINGKAVSVVASDSLTSIAQKVNGLNAGVTASLIDGGSGSAYLTFTSSKTGVSGKLQMADLSGSVLNNLGVVSGAASARESITNGVTGYNFSSQTATLGSLTNTTAVPASTVTINGTSVAIDPANDSLKSIANTINGSGAGVTATVRAVTDSNNSTSYKLDLVGAGSAPTLVDSNNVLQSLGILQQAPSTELVQGQDAEYKLDNVSLKSSSNTITSAIPGATLTLLKGSTTDSQNVTTPSTANLSLAQDISGASAKITNFVTAYNGVLGFIKDNSAFDSTSFASGPLFGDSTALSISNEINSALFSNVPGLSGSYTNLASIGFSLNTDAQIVVDSSKLSTALSQAPDKVSSLFQAIGNATTNNISYVSSSSKSKPSGSGGYAINISQLATQGSYAGEVAQTSASTQSENLTFNGGLFANTAYHLTVPSGSQASDIVHLINNDSTLKPLLTASLDSGGKLLLQSKKYGTNGNFTAFSNQSAATDNSGLGVGSLGTVVSGVDVAGTINGEAATGAGQFLTGNTGNATTEGLQIQYNGAATGAVGSISFTKGIGSTFMDLVNSFTDVSNGVIGSSTKQLQNQFDDLQKQVDFVNRTYNDKVNSLKAQFNAMDAAISALKAQGNQMLAMLGVSTSSNNSSSSTGTASILG